MFWILTALILGINIAPFLFFKTDIWNAQGIWVQLCLVLAVSYSFFDNPKKVLIKNKALMFLFGWVCVRAGITMFNSHLINRFHAQTFYPIWNFVMIICLYQLIVQYLNIKQITKILGYLRWVFIGTLLLCVLQHFGLGQFFEMLHKDNPQFNEYFNNPVVGLIGQPTHLAGLLGMSLPLLFLNKRRVDYLAMGLCWIILLFFTGTSKNDPAISGVAVGLVVTFYYLFQTKRKVFNKVLLLVILVGIVSLFILPKDVLLKYVSSQGRYDLWARYWPIAKDHFIMGAGLGMVQVLGINVGYTHPVHLHNEFYQILVELGFVGLIAFLYLVFDYFSQEAFEQTEVILKTIFLGFLVSCFFNYTAHLWFPSVIAVFAYSSMYAINNEERLRHG